jgi:hypothetical protein
LVIAPPGKRVSEEEKFDAKIQDKDDPNGDVDRSSRGVSAQISSTLDAKDYICSSSTPLISCRLFDCN